MSGLVLQWPLTPRSAAMRAQDEWDQVKSETGKRLNGKVTRQTGEDHNHLDSRDRL